MKKIYKFGPLSFSYDTYVTGTIGHVGIQNHEVFVWAEQNGQGTSLVRIVPTGVEYDGTYVGTVIEDDTGLVWHVVKGK